MRDINIYAFADEASAMIDEQIVAMKRNNLQGIEIRNVDGTNISDITVQKAKEVKSKFDDNGLVVWSIGSPIGKININDDFEPHLEKFKHTLEVADILGAKNIRLFSFYMPENEKPDIYKDKVIERLGRFIEIAENSNINLCHENEKGIYGDTPERCLEIFKALPKIKGIFDPANFVQCKIDTLNAWEMLKDYIYYMHIKDAKADGFIVPSGNGAGNIKKISEDFISRGGKDFTMEPHLIDFDGLSNLEREGEKTQSLCEFSDSNTAFDIACDAFKKLI
ncbi:MAG: sugar phosphate isomerase/epimerase family protein [Acutalibacteraceae bacterium]